jgi:alanyl-tRNA synthetase
MTERLYYTDSYCSRFSARVIEQLTWEGHPGVVLDRTAFYPAAGGQPADRGMLDGVAVLDVITREGDGAVVHILAQDPAGFQKPARSEVEGVLDWARRFDHMQQHSGQHILSAACEQVLDADTVGFHLGAEVSTVDINVARLDPAALAQVEELANRVIWEDRPVSARFVGPDELPTLPLRRPPAVEGAVRVVEVEGFDVNPCGGTHVARTGEIGLIKIVRSDHRGDETRVEFLCGGRALRDYRAKNALVNQLASRLTVGHWELEQAVERIQDEGKQLQQELRRARKQLLKTEAAELAEGALVCEPYRVVQRVWEGREPDELRALAQELAQRFGVAALLAGIGERVHLCFARAEGPGPDMAALLREACAQLGGKGGGQPHMAQGSAPAADAARVGAVLSGLLAKLDEVEQ